MTNSASMQSSEQNAAKGLQNLSRDPFVLDLPKVALMTTGSQMLLVLKSLVQANCGGVT